MTHGNEYNVYISMVREGAQGVFRGQQRDHLLQVLEACVESGALRGGHNHANQDSMARNPAVARLQAEDASSVGSRGSSGFGGSEFWDALRQVG